MSLIEQALNKSSLEIQEPAAEEPAKIPGPQNILKIPATSKRGRLYLLCGGASLILLLLALSLFILSRLESTAVIASAPGSSSPFQPAESASSFAMATPSTQQEEQSIPMDAGTPQPEPEFAIAPDSDPFEPLSATEPAIPIATAEREPLDSPVAHTEKAAPEPPAAPTDKQVTSLLNQAYLYAQNARYTRAIGCYDTILSLDPNQYDALLNRGIIRQNIGDIDGAMYDLTAALHINPDDQVILNALGVLYLAGGDKEQAQDSFIQAGDSTALINLALLYWQDRALEKVIATLREAERKDTQDPFVPYYMGLFYQQQGNAPAARGNFDKAVRLARKRGYTDLINQIEGLSGIH